MGEDVSEVSSPVKLERFRSCVALACLLLIWNSKATVAQRNFGLPSLINLSQQLFSPRRIDSIVKEAETATYPPDDFHLIVQDKISPSTPFPCGLREDRPKWRSDTRPTSVHELRPGDIDVIAAMGDSISGGNAAREETSLGILIMDRGVSFSGGGQGSWREFTTLPNIIKVFNPKLIGQALGRGDFLSYNAQLNVAVPGSLDYEIMNQIGLFMFKMKRDKRINFYKDWKMLTILIGHNNMCSYECIDRKKNSPEIHKSSLQEALDYLYKNVPRIYVNILSVLDPTIQQRLPISLPCQFLSRLGCTCMHRNSTLKEGMVQLSRVVRRYQEAERELVFSGRYEGREDFTVEFQPFLQLLNGPTEVEESDNPLLRELIDTELPIWSADCFHFNQRGMAEVSRSLWNNLLEPVGNKSDKPEAFIFRQFKCPTKERPYLFTKKNSVKFLKEGHQ